MKSIIKKVCLLAGILLACAPLSHATTPVTVSSTTNMGSANNNVIPGIFVARRNETVNAILTSTAPLNPGTTVNFEMSNNMQNWSILATTATGSGGFGPGLSILTPPVAGDTFYRWNIISTVTAGSNAAPIPFTLTIRDLDDNMSVIKSNKGLDAVYFNDDSMQVFGTLRPDRFQYQTVGSSAVSISSYTQFGWGALPTADKAYGLSAFFSSNTLAIDRSFVVMQATGNATQDGTGKNGLTMSATPTISTQTAQNGDVLTFTSLTSSITFQDNATLAGSGLKLGAATRSVGIGDVLQLVFSQGYWREVFFANNLEQ